MKSHQEKRDKECVITQRSAAEMREVVSCSQGAEATYYAVPPNSQR
jgi:hypothetical protein